MKRYVSNCNKKVNENLKVENYLATNFNKQGSQCPHKHQIQSDLSDSIIKTLPATAHKFYILNARVSYSNDIAFSVAEESNFIELVTVFRPGYSSPNRQQLKWSTL